MFCIPAYMKEWESLDFRLLNLKKNHQYYNNSKGHVETLD